MGALTPVTQLRVKLDFGQKLSQLTVCEFDKS